MNFKQIILTLQIIILFPFISNGQTINWVTETGLPLGSTLTNGQVITNFGGTGVTVTINVNVVGGFPKINGADGTKINIGNGNDNCSFTLTTSGEVALDITLFNNKNLQKGERITVSNVNNSNITIQETSSNGGGRMRVDGIAMTGALPSTIVEDDTAVVKEQNNGAGTQWNASMNGVTSFTWLYNTAAGTSANEGFSLNINSTTLPIELLFFDATFVQESESILLEWQTASEINNDYFTIEKSQNGIDWRNLKTVDGAGNSSTLLNYEASDINPYMGVSYYRLKQTDFDGEFSYSNIKSINFNLVNNQIEIFPNPTKKQITITGNKSEIETINIYNVLGQNVTNKTIIKKLDNKVIIELSKLSEGTYYIRTKTTANKVYKQ